MRPRNLLNLLNYCKSNAVNLQHSKIQEEDIRRACAMYSADIGNEIGLEIRDVFPQAEDILYCFIGAAPVLTVQQVRECLSESPISKSDHDRLIEILMWFGFLGIRQKGATEFSETYIYDVYYDMKKLRRLARNLAQDQTELTIHPAFWPFLGIDERGIKIH